MFVFYAITFGLLIVGVIMIERFIKDYSSNSDLLDIKSSPHFVYFSGVKGTLITHRISGEARAFFIVHSKSKLFARNALEDELIFGAGVMCCDYSSGLFIELDHDDQVIVASDSVLSGISKRSTIRFMCKNPYESLMCDLFSQIKPSKESINELYAIINLTAIAMQRQDEEECVILATIRDNFADPYFSLNDLCALLHMSRRKVQYRLNERGESFSELVKKMRVMQLKQDLSVSISTGRNLTSIAFKAGFKSLSKANKEFLDVVGLTIKEHLLTIKLGGRHE